MMYFRLRRHRIHKTKAFIESIFYHLSQLYKHNNELATHKYVSSEVAIDGSMGTPQRPKTFVEFVEKSFCINHLSDIHKRSVLIEANSIVNKKFKILGETVNFQDCIDWHIDFKSGYRWPQKYYKRLLPVFNEIDDTDGKMPYELSRFSHLSVLGMAFGLTGEEKYALEYVDEVEQWIDNNPYPFGVNWTCAMDVSIRACNFILGFGFFKKAKLLNNEYIHKMIESLHQHGSFIMKNLEVTGNSRFTTNHYLSDVAGLIYLGALVPELKSANEYLEFGTKEIIKEMHKQVYYDGCDFEASTCYHRLVLELFFFSALAVIINDDNFNDQNYKEVCESKFGRDYTEKLYRMFEVVLYLTKPDGRMPQIGDNDSGQLHKFSEKEVLDMRYLLTMGAIFFKEPRFKVKEFGFSEDAIWVFGESGYYRWNRMNSISISEIKSRAFLETGWFVIRHGSDYCIVSCGPNGGDGWHSHNDKLSFELVLDGQTIIVDPGTFVYTSDIGERNKYRSTGYHNTLKFDELEQNEIAEQDMFFLPDRVKILNADLQENDEEVVFQGEIQYLEITHKRVVVLTKKTGNWKITDSFLCGNPVNAKAMFHLDPDLTCDGNKILTKDKRKIVASIDMEDFELTKENYDYSPEYGVKIHAERLAASVPFERMNSKIITNIRKAG